MTTECEAPTHGQEIEAMVGEAMSLIGARRFAEARATVEAIEAADPTNNWGAHARIHLHIDEGSLEEGAIRGIAHLEAVDPFQDINVHNAMHLATILLDLGRVDESIAWQTRVVVPVAEAMPMQYPSATHLLWRTEVAGHGRGASRALPWEILVRPGATSLKASNEQADPVGAIAHGMAWIANGDGARSEALLATLLAPGLEDSGLPGSQANSATVAAIIDGLYRWWECDYTGAADVLRGAHAGFGALTQYTGQLGAVEETLIDAEWRAGTTHLAERILRARVTGANIPNPFDVALLAKLTSTP